MLWEQSIHHFDLLRFVYGQEPIVVQCHTWNPSWSMYAHDTNVAAIFTFERGIIVNYQGTWQGNWNTPHFEWRTECTAGIISQRDQFGDLYYARRDDPELTRVALPPHETWITETMALLDAFVRSTLDAAPLECSGRDHLQVTGDVGSVYPVEHSADVASKLTIYVPKWIDMMGKQPARTRRCREHIKSSWLCLDCTGRSGIVLRG